MILAPDGDQVPERVGPWRLLREIGCGGMGVVFLAERDDGEYKKTAALKLMREGYQSQAFVNLFRRERQILAQLNHPNIARLFDGGTTPAGQPYYVMEFVEGEPPTAYCTQRHLSVPERLRLFLDICRAVSYAHRRLFIHRDLKPGNILVTARGEPKLLDFGLAKIFDPAGDPRTPTPAMSRWTPAYASPEQLLARHLTTASDVYSLGVILYELLAERSPYRVQGHSLFRLCDAVCKQVPAPPSSIRRFRHAADLDAIVLKALHKEPEQRYHSVDALIADIEAYLAGMPVAARRGDALYRLRRYVTRHRWALAVSTAAIAGASATFGAVLWEQHRAEQRFQDLRFLARSVVFELHDAIEGLPGSTATRKLLVQRSLKYLNNLEQASGRDLNLKWELAEAYKRIGDAQGNTSRANLGDSAGALDSYGHARALLHEIIAARSGDVRALETMASLDSTSADILNNRGDGAEALRLRREASDLLQQVAARQPTTAARRRLALSHYSLAFNLNQMQDWPAALREWQETLRQYQQIAREDPSDPNMQRNVALSHKRLASVYLQTEQLPQALEHYRAAERIDRERVAADPSDSEAKMDLSFDLSDIGLAHLTAGRHAEAVKSYEGTVALRREVAAADPDDSRAQLSVGRGLDRLARAYESAGRLDRAVAASREATVVLNAVRLHDPANQDTLRSAALSFARLGSLYRARGDCGAAIGAYERARELLAGLKPGMQISGEERERVAGLPAALAECRSRLR